MYLLISFKSFYCLEIFIFVFCLQEFNRQNPVPPKCADEPNYIAVRRRAFDLLTGSYLNQLNISLQTRAFLESRAPTENAIGIVNAHCSPSKPPIYYTFTISLVNRYAGFNALLLFIVT